MAAILWVALTLAVLFIRVIEPAAFFMTRRMSIGLKRRAGALAAARAGRPSHAA